jgi:hypothetical protein
MVKWDIDDPALGSNRIWPKAPGEGAHSQLSGGT